MDIIPHFQASCSDLAGPGKTATAVVMAAPRFAGCSGREVITMRQRVEAADTASGRPTVSRRAFAGGAAGAAAAVMVHSSLAAAEETRELRLGVIGCGGRGSGAINDSLSINDGVRLVATADLYAPKCAALWKAMRQAHPDKVAADETIAAGLDGYKRVLDDRNVDIVLITTSPGFRPLYLRDAVAAGKHVFAEKPGCVDPAGYRLCLETHDAAVAKGVAVVAGTQYRRQVNYIGAVEQIRQGAIGDVLGATARYCAGGIWYRPREDGMSDAEYQLNNWMHFIWLSGDQIAEQAVHNLDTINWVMGDNPVRAFGSGGRFTRCRSCAGRFPARRATWATWCMARRASATSGLPTPVRGSSTGRAPRSGRCPAASPTPTSRSTRISSTRSGPASRSWSSGSSPTARWWRCWGGWPPTRGRR
jgi:predicted dehydrogenase